MAMEKLGGKRSGSSEKPRFEKLDLEMGFVNKNEPNKIFKIKEFIPNLGEIVLRDEEGTTTESIQGNILQEELGKEDGLWRKAA
jgi:hypothetical protein